MIHNKKVLKNNFCIFNNIVFTNFNVRTKKGLESFHGTFNTQFYNAHPKEEDFPLELPRTEKCRERKAGKFFSALWKYIVFKNKNGKCIKYFIFTNNFCFNNVGRYRFLVKNCYIKIFMITSILYAYLLYNKKKYYKKCCKLLVSFH